MACKRSSEQDPDYENIDLYHAKRMRILEQDAKEASVKKISNIIKSQFAKAVSEKEEELACLNQRLHQAKVVMDRLRAYIVASYYGSLEKFPVEQGQNIPQRIHPAVKNLLIGKKPKNHVESEALSNYSSSNNSCDFPYTDTGSSSNSSIKVQKKAETNLSSSTSNQQENQVAINANSNNSESTRASRFKIFKKIIVGNVSKFIPPDKREGNDLATHKWMVYVRGPKEEPSIDHYVKKVWFFLHPSYRPNDFIEVSKPPFHLTRRGWGEFPVRVQIHFHDARNKRIDVVHMLKLDKTYTGLQTLGAETNVTMYLYKPDVPSEFHLQENAQLMLLTEKAETLISTEDPDFSSAEKTYPAPEEKTERMDPADFSNIVVQEEVEVMCDTKPSELTSLENPLSVSEQVKSEPQNDATENLSLSPVVNKLKATVSNSLLKSKAIETDVRISFVSNLTEKSLLVNTPKESDAKSLISPDSGNKNNIIKNKPNVNHLQIQNTVLESNNVTGQNSALESASLSCKPFVPEKRYTSGGISLLRNNRILNSSVVNKPETFASSSNAGSLASILRPPKPNLAGKSLISSAAASSSSLSSVPSSSALLPETEQNTPNPTVNSLKIHSSTPSTASSILLLSSFPKVNSTLQTVKNTSAVNSLIHNTKSLLEKNQSSPNLTKVASQLSISANKPQTIPNNNYLTYIKCVDKQGNIFLVPQSALIKSTSDDSMMVSPLSNSKTGVIQLIPSSGASNQAQLVRFQPPLSKPSITIARDKGKIVSSQVLSESTPKESVVAADSDAEKELLPDDPKSVVIEDCRSMKEIMKRFLKYFPLICENAVKTVHPYCASSLSKYFSWCIGKQRAAEWQRARAVRLAVLEALSKSEYWKETKAWTTKAIVIFCRHYGYTPLKGDIPEEIAAKSDFTSQEINTYTEHRDLMKKLEKLNVSSGSMSEELDDIEIDIETIEEVAKIKIKKERQDNNSDKLYAYHPMSAGAEFVHEEISMLGIKLQPQEIHPGVKMSVVEEILFQLGKSFVEDILRNSLAHKFERLKEKRWCNVIAVDDILQCILNQSEFKFLTNEYLGKNVPLSNKEEGKT